MAWSNGVYSRLYSWVTDRDNAIKVRADRMDGEFDEIVTALNALTSGGVSHIAAMRGYSGSASLPGYSFDGDLNSGFYRIGADNVGIAVNGGKIVDVATTGATVTGTLDASKGTDVASASTLNLDTATGMFPDVTGTTTVTAVTLAAGKMRMARARGAFQITASASLIVNNSTTENYICAAGDLLLFEGYASSVVRVQTISGGADTATEDRLNDLETTVDFLSVVVADLYGNYLGMARGWSDSFDTQDGIDTTASTNEAFTTGYYLPTTSGTAPSYSNTGGQGDRTASIVETTTLTTGGGSLSQFIDGSNSNAYYLTVQAVAGKYWRFDFGTPQIITESLIRYTGSSGMAFGTWKWQGSDDASAWSDVGAAAAMALDVAFTAPAAGTTAYRYWQLIGVSGNCTDNWLQEITFKITDQLPTSNNMTLISNEFAAPANVGETAAFLDIEFASSLTPGTDFDFAMTSAGTPSYTSTGATYSLWYSSGNTKRYVVEGIDLTAQADDAVRARFRTLTNKAIKITGWRPRWEDA